MFPRVSFINSFKQFNRDSLCGRIVLIARQFVDDQDFQQIVSCRQVRIWGDPKAYGNAFGYGIFSLVGNGDDFRSLNQRVAPIQAQLAFDLSTAVGCIAFCVIDAQRTPERVRTMYLPHNGLRLQRRFRILR